nr:protein O-glucosyltransferase 2-like [Nerophis lumbriciformis]
MAGSRLRRRSISDICVQNQALLPDSPTVQSLIGWSLDQPESFALLPPPFNQKDEAFREKLRIMFLQLWWSLLGLVVFRPARADPGPSAVRTLVWGPGLEANIVLPVRFFFIQAVDNSGRNLTTSPGEKTFEVKIVSPSEHFTRIWIQVLDRQDGSLLVRYRMYASYADLHIHVLLGDQHVAKSPYVLRGPVYHEGCDCPQLDGSAWQSHMRCPHSFPQIERDLSHFASIDPERNDKEIPQRFGQRQSLCHYTIKDNKIYLQTLGEHVGFRIFMDAILLSLSRKVKLPDMEFFVNLGDWPLEKRKPSQNLHPIFSWCGSNNTRDIVMPTYDLTESVLETMGRVSLDMMSVQANTGPPWAKKNATAFWRGRDSRQERLELVKLSRAHPHMIDAAFTNFFFFKHDESLFGPLVKHVSFFDFFKYKYQINIDGTVAAYRLPYLLAGDSVVFKQDSGYYEHFYNELAPWEHYIPIRADLRDLLDKIQWARDHDEEAKKIALAGQQFARKELMGDNIFCYYYKLFQEYAKRQVTQPKIRQGMELVEQPSDDLFPCSCLRTQAKDEL